MSNQEGPQGKGLIQFSQCPSQTRLTTQTPSTELQPVVDLQIQDDKHLKYRSGTPNCYRLCHTHTIKHTHLSLLHRVGSVEAKSGSNTSQVPTDRVGIVELDGTEGRKVNTELRWVTNEKATYCTNLQYSSILQYII